MTDLLSSARPAARPVVGVESDSPSDHRPDWSWLPDPADAPRGERLDRHRRATDRLVADRGVTYGADTVETGASLWRLDPVPVLVDEQEWAGLDAALVQRAELLDAVLRDLYGARRLLRDDVLPPELVLAHPGFLRAVDGLRLPGPRELVLTATDLSRDAAGGWTAISDRTQAPSGAGYAMEDRRIVAQVLADVYRQASIQRIGPFFHALRLALTEAAPPGVDAPRAVLLTAGPYSETAFDQAYLASMLGLPMVEGTDLVVRDGRLWMRGLDAPEPVDVVLRRIDADYADPLDLRSDSRLGVPGLVRAVRGGSVSVVNPLGTSVLENAGLLAHLARLAQVVLGQDLALGSPATYWCGDDAARAHVLARLDTLVLKPTARGARHTTVLGWTLDRAQREELAARIVAEPGLWVGQEPVSSGAAVLRTFAVAHRGSYHVMAGGLARVAPDAGQRVSSALGAVAKDVWVMSSQPYAVADPWVRSPAGAARAGGDLGSETAGAPAPRQFLGGVSPRTAENLFWMGRYAERAGGTVRAMRAVVDRWDDFHHTPDSPGGRALAALVTALGVQPPSGPTTAGPQPDGSTTDLPDLRSLLLDRALPGSVAWCTRRLAEAAAAVRDQLSADIWLPLASIERALTDERRAVAGLRPGSVAAAEDTTGMRPVLDRMLEALLAVAGIEAESLVRDAGWRFLDAGRRLERAQALVESLAATVTRLRGDDVDSLVLESVLIGHESIITYRRRNQARAGVATVLDLLLGDAGNPRSLAFQLDRLRDDLASIPAPAFPTDTRDRLLSDVTDLLTELDTSAVSAAVTEDGRRERLAEVLDSMRWRLRSAAEEIARVHFVHPAPSRTVGDTWDAESAALPTVGAR